MPDIFTTFLLKIPMPESVFYCIFPRKFEKFSKELYEEHLLIFREFLICLSLQVLLLELMQQLKWKETEKKGTVPIRPHPFK